MTDDLERAAEASMMRAHDGRRADHKDCVIAAIRALETPSSSVVEAMAKGIWASNYPTWIPWEEAKTSGYNLDESYQKMALAAWRAGIGAIVGGNNDGR